MRPPSQARIGEAGDRRLGVSVVCCSRSASRQRRERPCPSPAGRSSWLPSPLSPQLRPSSKVARPITIGRPSAAAWGEVQVGGPGLENAANLAYQIPGIPKIPDSARGMGGGIAGSWLPGLQVLAAR